MDTNETNPNTSTTFSGQITEAVKRMPIQKVPATLLSNIFLKIERRQKNIAGLHFAINSALLLASVGIFVWGTSLFNSEINSTGSIPIFQLLFTDFKVISLNWQSYGLSLLETFPVMSALMVLASLAVIIIVLRNLVTTFFTMHPFHNHVQNI